MHLFRIIGWNPETNEELNIGLAIAETRREAIARRTKAESKLILDAYPISELTEHFDKLGRAYYVTVHNDHTNEAALRDLFGAAKASTAVTTAKVPG